MSCAIWWMGLILWGADATGIAQPKAHDPRLKIELYAAEPDIVTPTGIAVDSQGRVLVVESHTHFRPSDYQGPPADRIRVFEGTKPDGKAQRVSTFYEGTKWTMNAGVHPDGSLYVATRGEIFRLRDRDGDGRAEERTSIARLETKGDYPHNGLSGFAFDFDGNVYFGLGENLGLNFKLVGTDGSSATELEGGQIYRCRADGSHVELVAFGFWNPFHLAFDTFGRLFAVDNDPDSLPPCRLMHIVPGGNYGYRYRNGRKGVHPFTAWNGELPGTLPMVAGTGEAPSGVLVYESDHLPAEYVGDVLSTSWGDHRIERFHLEPRGASFRATGAPIVSGDENFRPVGIAVAPDGSLFVSDWVDKSYNVHGKGRIWHITAPDTKPAARPQSPQLALHSPDRTVRENVARKLVAEPKIGRPLLQKLAQSDDAPRVRAVATSALVSAGDFESVRSIAMKDQSIDVRTLAIRSLPSEQQPRELLTGDAPPEVRAEALRRVKDAGHADVLWKYVSDPDAFIAQAAREGLARSRAVTAEIALSKTNPAERLAGLLVLRETRDPAGRQALAHFLRDPDSAVRFAAIQWVAEERLTELGDSLHAALSAGPATARLFGGYLAALERLEGVKRTPSDEWAGEQYIVRALDDPKTTPEVRLWSLRMLRPDHPALSLERLKGYLAGDDAALRLEAVRTLRDSPHDGRATLLADVAADAHNSIDLRAEAIVGLSPSDPRGRALLLDFALGDQRALRDEALRSLRGAECDATQREALRRVAAADSSVAELVERVLEPNASIARPAVDDLPGWLKLLGDATALQAGDAKAGERIFFHHRSAGCSRCHRIGGRGANVGPELTATTGALSAERLIESIVRPSKEIAPQFATWLVVTTDGKSLVGMIVKELATGEQTYADSKGELLELKPSEIESRRAQSTSIMPDGLAQQLTVREFRDLLAFLRSQPAAGK